MYTNDDGKNQTKVLQVNKYKMFLVSHTQKDNKLQTQQLFGEKINFKSSLCVSFVAFGLEIRLIVPWYPLHNPYQSVT